MSTRTIAVDSRVYERLAEVKMEGESFSKTIDRLLTQVGAAHTGGDILSSLAEQSPLPAGEAETFLEVVRENRTSESWEQRDLR